VPEGDQLHVRRLAVRAAESSEMGIIVKDKSAKRSERAVEAE
jgi:hypothetical protein